MQRWDGTNLNFLYIAFLIFFVNGALFGQVKEGEIIFERRTNLEKKFKDSEFRRKSIDGQNKIKTENFVLFFNDSLSIFKPIISDEIDPTSWATTRNTVYHNLSQNNKFIFLNVFGKDLIVKDTVGNRIWKITESKRTIAGYECYKSIWQKDDSTRIYAWFTPDIIASVGPEGFDGLPGTILGLATEDGGIIYFAKEVRIIKPLEKEFTVDLKKKDIYTKAELKDKFEKEYSNSSFGKRIFTELFRWL
jgi:GLPGLI family protein